MRLQLVAIGQRMPDWVDQGVADYQRRLKKTPTPLEVKPVAAPKRGRGADVERLCREEGEALLAAVPRGALCVALDGGGRAWSTAEFARQLDGWMHGGRDVALLVGGADGLSPECLARCEQHWSLSPLTFPHALVRVIVAEQIYRAASLLQGHPYHRE